MLEEEVFHILEPEVTESVYGKQGLSKSTVSLLNKLNRAGMNSLLLPESSPESGKGKRCRILRIAPPTRS